MPRLVLMDFMAFRTAVKMVHDDKREMVCCFAYLKGYFSS